MNDECILWAFSRNKEGYALYNVDRKQYLLHRIITNAKRGEEVLHSCDNPGCINPKHLSLGSHKDNMDDRDRKGRQTRGTNHHTTRHTEDDIRSIRKESLAHQTYKSIAEKWGCSETTAYNIINRLTWRHIKDEELIDEYLDGSEDLLGGVEAEVPGTPS